MDEMELKYYNKEMHSAAFALPRFVQKVSVDQNYYFLDLGGVYIRVKHHKISR